jgi:hypothetical protein
MDDPGLNDLQSAETPPSRPPRTRRRLAIWHRSRARLRIASRSVRRAWRRAVRSGTTGASVLWSKTSPRARALRKSVVTRYGLLVDAAAEAVPHAAAWLVHFVRKHLAAAIGALIIGILGNYIFQTFVLPRLSTSPDSPTSLQAPATQTPTRGTVSVSYSTPVTVGPGISKRHPFGFRRLASRWRVLSAR